MFSILQTDGPHVIQPVHGGTMSVLYVKIVCPLWQNHKKSNIPGISIITSKYPQLIIIDCGPVCRPCHWQAETEATNSIKQLKLVFWVSNCQFSQVSKEIQTTQQMILNSNIKETLPPFHFPFSPLPCCKFVFKQIIFVFQVWVRVDVASIAPWNKLSQLLQDPHHLSLK